MTQRLSALTTVFILNIALLFACTLPEADVGEPTTNQSDIVSGSDRVYALEVGPGQTLSAEVAPEGDWDATVTLSAEASDLSESCLSWRDEGVAQATNTSTESTTFFVIVDGFHGHSRGRFTLTTAIN